MHRSTISFNYLIHHQDRSMGHNGLKNFLSYNIGTFFFSAFIDNSSALSPPFHQTGKFETYSTDIKFSSLPVKAMVEKILARFTNEKIQEIVGRRHSQEVVQETIRRRDILEKWYAKYQAERKPKNK